MCTRVSSVTVNDYGIAVAKLYFINEAARRMNNLLMGEYYFLTSFICLARGRTDNYRVTRKQIMTHDWFSIRTAQGGGGQSFTFSQLSHSNYRGTVRLCN